MASTVGDGTLLDRDDAPRPRRGRLSGVVIALAIVWMFALVAPLFSDPVDQGAPPARRGVIDLGGRAGLGRPMPLAGEWRLTWLAPDLPRGDEGPLAIQVPGTWSRLERGGAQLPRNAIARYDLLIRGLQPGPHVLHVPPILAASQVELGASRVSIRGEIGDSAADTRYEPRAHNLAFEATGAELPLRITLATWQHRDNGILDVPVVGAAEPMERWYALKWARELLYTISVILIAALSIAVFAFRRDDRASLFFGLACLAFLPTVSVLGFDNLLMLEFPMLDLRTMLAVQYLPGAAAVGLFLAYTHELFPAECPRWIFIVLLVLIVGLLLGQAVLLAAGDTLTTSWVQGVLFMPVAMATLLFVVVAVVRAALRRREGAFIFLLGTVPFVASFLLAGAVFTGYANRSQVVGFELTALGAVILLYSHVVLMALRWSHASIRAERMNRDLRELLSVNTAITSDLQLGSLLEKIVGVTSKIIRADRSSLMLKEPDHAKLTSLVAQGVEGGRISFDIGRGLAGYAFATGEIVNVPDAYADARFNRSVDDATGYRTRSVLTVPITARDGRRIGVMQALNREDGLPFSDEDAARMSAFGAQAAVAIDNARLFGEAVAARNFDDSILRSMSGGVLALDADWKITKLNAAASEILGASKTLLGGLDARALLGGNNPWLIEEIAAVGRSGEPKLLLDVALVTARGADKPSSVNLSIAPLLGEAGPVGTLLVIEDISEEKRLQGTMRRFMTQSVVDQVLGREDELLFGTACTASVLFADIRNFTALAEELSARQTVETLNELFTELFEAVAAHEGVLDKYIGDAIMAVYGAPLSTGRDPENALASARDMLRMLDAINARRVGRGAAAMRIGIGIASGEVVAGTIGSPKRMDYTVIGDSVNLAARLQDLTKVYGVELLVCERTAAVADKRELRALDLIAVRGRKRPETIYQVLSRPAADAQAQAALLAAYAAGRAALAARDWAGALGAFARASEADPSDRPARLMLARARALAGAPPSELWDGVWRDQAAEAA